MLEFIKNKIAAGRDHLARFIEILRKWIQFVRNIEEDSRRRMIHVRFKKSKPENDASDN